MLYHSHLSFIHLLMMIINSILSILCYNNNIIYQVIILMLEINNYRKLAST